MSAEHPAVVYETFIRTTPEQLWQALTNPSFTKEYFFQSEIRSELQAGKPAWYASADGSIALDGEIVEITPPRRLVHTIRIPLDPELAPETSRLIWVIEPRGRICKLTLTHDVAGAPRTAARVPADEWKYSLASLKSLLETGKALEYPMPSAT